MDTRRNRRGIKVKRCCASCANKEINDQGKRSCSLGYASCLSCRHWRMREELRNAGTPFGVIKTKEYLRHVRDIRLKEQEDARMGEVVEPIDIKEIRKEYNNSINLKF